MAAADNEIIDRAMDAAEALQADKGVITATEVETPAETPTTKETETPEESVAIKKTLDHKERDESGKFQKTKTVKKGIKEPEPQAEESQQVSDQEASVENQGAQPTVAPTELTPTEVPAFWPAELKSALAEAKSDDAKLIAKQFTAYTVQQEQFARRIANESERARINEKRVWEGMEPTQIERHKAELSLNGLKDHIDELHRYRNWDTVFKSDVRLGTVQLLQKNGLTPYDLVNYYEGVPQSQQEQYQDPRVDEVKQEFEDYKRQQVESQVSAEIEAFKQGTDLHGQSRGQFIAMYEPQIANAAGQIRGLYPDLSRADVLTHAYNYTMEQVRQLHGVTNTASIPKPALQIVPKTKEQIVANATKASNASGSVSGAPSTAASAKRPRLKGDNFNEKVESAIDNAFERAEAS